MNNSNPFIPRNSNELEEAIRKSNVAFEPLSADLLEDGSAKVEKAILFKNHMFEAAVLKLAPGAKVKKHPHLHDHEIYYFVNEERTEICICGCEHELANNTDVVMSVISIKITKGYEFDI